MQNTRRQHYVPQFYLKKFSENGTSVFVFDKTTDSVFETNTHNIAQERYFFDLPQEVVKDKDPRVLEEVFSEMETDYGSLLDEIQSSLARKKRFNPKHKFKMSLFVIIQYFRTREYRERDAALRAATLDLMNQELAREGLKLKYGYREEAANHLIRLFDPDMLNILTKILKEYIWIIWNNKTKHPFYTSDNPIVVASELEDPAGFASPGVEVLLPITSKLLLSICDRQFFASSSGSDCKSIGLHDVTRVEYYNRLQVMSSSRQVYCSADDFGLAKEVCAQNPSIRDPNRSRIEIEKIGDLMRIASKKTG